MSYEINIYEDDSLLWTIGPFSSAKEAAKWRYAHIADENFSITYTPLIDPDDAIVLIKTHLGEEDEIDVEN